MKKIVLIVIPFFLFPLIAESIDGKYWGEIKDDVSSNSLQTFYTFEENKYSLEIDLTGAENLLNIPNNYIRKDSKLIFYNEHGEYNTLLKNGFTYVIFNSNDLFTIKNDLGVLKYKNFLMLIDGKRIFFQNFTNYFDSLSTYNINTISTSSFLIEGKIIYNGENFKYIQNDMSPWVEGVPGSGIGEWIELVFSNNNQNNTQLGFLISNGYVDSKRPDLFFANNRVKTFNIKSKDLNIDCNINLSDTPNLQYIHLSNTSTYKGDITVRFIIKEIFEGNKYNDTCVNLILPINCN